MTGPPLTEPAVGPGPADTSGAPSYGAGRQAKGLLKMTLSPSVNHFRHPYAREASTQNPKAAWAFSPELQDAIDERRQKHTGKLLTEREAKRAAS